MQTAIKRENDEFFGHSLKHVSGVTLVVNRPKAPKPWAITHEKSQNTRNDEFFGHSIKHVSGVRVVVNRLEIPKTMGNCS